MWKHKTAYDEAKHMASVAIHIINQPVVKQPVVKQPDYAFGD